jgi:hypothetical protein
MGIIITHRTNEAITPSAMGFAPQYEIAFIHSHPNERTGITIEEFASMGWRMRNDADNDHLRSHRGTPGLQGDSRIVATNEDNRPSFQYYYTYFPYSGNIYRVRGWEHPEFIRNIRNHNNNPNRLFWGVLNGR